VWELAEKEAEEAGAEAPLVDEEVEGMAAGMAAEVVVVALVVHAE